MKDRRLTDSAFAIWVRTVLYPITMLLSRTKVKYKIIIENKHMPAADKPIIFACNHSAFPDIPIALRAVKRHSYTLIGKQNLAFVDKTFFFLAGAVWIDRKSKESSALAKERIVAYLKKDYPILWFPEATWNLTDNSLMLPMRWGIIEVAQRTNAQIIPMALDYDRTQKICRVRFGEALNAEAFTSKQQGIITLRDTMATLRWDFISRNQANRADIDLEKERDVLFQVVRDYPPLNWNYEESCIYRVPWAANHHDAFAYLNTINPTLQNAFLFNKKLK